MRRKKVEPDSEPIVWGKVKRQIRLEFDGDEWKPTSAQVSKAISQVRRAAHRGIIETRLGRTEAARGRLSEHGLLTALKLNGDHKGHKASVTEIVRLLVWFDKETLRRLGMPNFHAYADPYGAVEKLLIQLAVALRFGWDHVDCKTGKVIRCDRRWYGKVVSRAGIPVDTLEWMWGKVDAAVDSTEMESCGQFRTGPDPVPLVLDGEIVLPDVEDIGEAKPKEKTPKSPKVPRKALVMDVGDDGRIQYTPDKAARIGWRTENNNHDGENFNGRDLHTYVAVPKLEHTDGVTYATFGPPVPPVILGYDLVPANTHRAKTVLPGLIELHEEGLGEGVIADAGYTMAMREVFHLVLQAHGIWLTMRPSAWQRGDTTDSLLKRAHRRGEKLDIADDRVIDGALIVMEVDDEGNEIRDDVDLSMPPVGATNAEKEPYIKKFNKRAQRRRRRKSPRTDGTTRWDHPVERGILRSREVPSSMRKSRKGHLIKLPVGASTASITVSADALPWWQRCVFGTTAWHLDNGRRNIVEYVYSRLHGATGSLTEISRGYTKLVNDDLIHLFMAHTIAGANAMIVHEWQRQQRILEVLRADPAPRVPRKGRVLRRSDIPALAGIVTPAGTPTTADLPPP
jgi:hypothetical protein